MIAVTARDGAIVFAAPVIPEASCGSIDAEFQCALKVHLTASPVGGRANDALRRPLADCLNVPLPAVKILSGENSRTKRIEVRGIVSAHAQSLA